MSHNKTLSFLINDLDCLAKAAEHIGMELRLNQTHYHWFGKFMGDYALPEGFDVSEMGKCLHAISIKGNSQAYEVGVVQSKTNPGEYQLIYDFWSGGHGLEAVVGKDCDNLLQRYQVEVLKQQLILEGHSITEQWNEEEQEYVINTY